MQAATVPIPGHPPAEDRTAVASPQTPEGNTITVQLKHGVEDRGVALPALTMPRPKLQDQLRAQMLSGVSDAEREVRLFADLCRVRPAPIQDLDLQDYNTRQSAFHGFSKREE